MVLFSTCCVFGAGDEQPPSPEESRDLLNTPVTHEPSADQLVRFFSARYDPGTIIIDDHIPHMTGATPMHILARGGYNELLEQLVQRLSQEQTIWLLSQLDSRAATPMHYAIRNGNDIFLQILLAHLPKEDILVFIGATDDTNSTPNHYAASDGNEKYFQTLQSHYSNNPDLKRILEIKDTDGDTSLDVANNCNDEGKFEDIVQLILELMWQKLETCKKFKHDSCEDADEDDPDDEDYTPSQKTNRKKRNNRKTTRTFSSGTSRVRSQRGRSSAHAPKHQNVLFATRVTLCSDKASSVDSSWEKFAESASLSF